MGPISALSRWPGRRREAPQRFRAALALCGPALQIAFCVPIGALWGGARAGRPAAANAGGLSSVWRPYWACEHSRGWRSTKFRSHVGWPGSLLLSQSLEVRHPKSVAQIRPAAVLVHSLGTASNTWTSSWSPGPLHSWQRRMAAGAAPALLSWPGSARSTEAASTRAALPCSRWCRRPRTVAGRCATSDRTSCRRVWPKSPTIHRDLAHLFTQSPLIA